MMTPEAAKPVTTEGLKRREEPKTPTYRFVVAHRGPNRHQLRAARARDRHAEPAGP